MQITRRDALTGASAAVAATIVPTVARATVNRPTEIERLYADLRRWEAAWYEAVGVHADALQNAKALYPESPFPNPESPGIWPPRLAFHALLKTPGHDAADKIYYRKSLKRLDAYDAECDRIKERFGAAELKRVADAAWERIVEIHTVILDTPARTYRDVLLKLLAEHPEGEWEKELENDGELYGPIAVAVKRDLERLAGEARP